MWLLSTGWGRVTTGVVSGLESVWFWERKAGEREALFYE